MATGTYATSSGSGPFDPPGLEEPAGPPAYVVSLLTGRKVRVDTGRPLRLNRRNSARLDFEYDTTIGTYTVTPKNTVLIIDGDAVPRDGVLSNGSTIECGRYKMRFEVEP